MPEPELPGGVNERIAAWCEPKPEAPGQADFERSPECFWSWNAHEKQWFPPCRFRNDLNACAKFEERLDLDQWKEYTIALLDLTGDTDEEMGLGHIWGCLHASAPQRCDALLKVIDNA